MWWKTVLIALGAIALIVFWGVIASHLIPGEDTGPYLVRFALSFIVGLSVGRLAYVAWDAWTDNDRRW